MTVATERIDRLHELAREATKECNEDRAREYVRRARRIAERNRLRLPCEFLRFTCDGCDAYIVPGKNGRVRLQSGHVTLACDCGTVSRYPYDDS